MRKIIFVQVVLCLCFTACRNSITTNSQREITECGDTVTLAASSAIIGRLTIQEARLEPWSAEFRTVGTVRAQAGSTANLAAPFDGRITKACVAIGQKVHAGQKIFELSSSDFVTASKTYFQAVRNAETAQKNYDRKKALLAGGIASQREAEEAQTDADNARHEREQTEAELKIFNVDPSTLKMGQPMSVCSPISGEVVECEITVGQYVKSDAEPVATVVDLRKVWVTALVKEHYFGAIHKGDRVEIYTDAEPGKVVWGEIYHIGEILDEQTRSLRVIVACDNTERRLKIGMFTSVHFLGAPQQAILLPATAVFQGEARSYVYVKDADNTYIRRTVTVESDKRGTVHVIDGIAAGDEVVTDGGIYLSE